MIKFVSEGCISKLKKEIFRCKYQVHYDVKCSSIIALFVLDDFRNATMTLYRPPSKPLSCAVSNCCIHLFLCEN